MRFENFRRLLDSGFSSTVVMGRLMKKLTPKEDAVMQWQTQAVSVTANLKVRIYFNLPELSATKIMKWNCHMDDSAKVRYDTILGIYILTALGLNLKFSDHVIEADDGNFKGSTAPMFDMGNYEFKDFNAGKIAPEEPFMKAYSRTVYESLLRGKSVLLTNNYV